MIKYPLFTVTQAALIIMPLIIATFFSDVFLSHRYYGRYILHVLGFCWTTDKTAALEFVLVNATIFFCLPLFVADIGQSKTKLICYVKAFGFFFALTYADMLLNDMYEKFNKFNFDRRQEYVASHMEGVASPD
jgi:hypothetical protein